MTMSFRSAIYIFLICTLGAQAGLGVFAAQTDDDTKSGDVDIATRVCLPDAMEDNDSQATASLVTPGVFTGLTSCARDDDFYTFAVAEDEVVTATVTFEHTLGDIDIALPITDGHHASLHVCELDEDWHSIPLLADTELTVDATFLDTEGDLEMQLRSPTGTLLVVADSTTDNETLGPYATTVAGDYRLRIYLNGDDGVTLGNAYSLDVSIGVPAICPVDAFEQNDTDAAAALLAEGTHTGLHVCNSDADWYRIPLVAGAVLTVESNFSHAEGDLDLSLQRSGGRVVARAGTDTTRRLWGPSEHP